MSLPLFILHSVTVKVQDQYRDYDHEGSVGEIKNALLLFGAENIEI